MRKGAAILGVVILTGVSCLHIALVLGLPASQLAWGGQFTGTLPVAYRWASLPVVAVLTIAAWVVMSRADMVWPGSKPFGIRIAMWLFTVYFGLNTLGNLASQSSIERLVMTPLTLALVACFAVVAFSRRQH